MDKKEFADYVITSVRSLSLVEVLGSKMRLIQRGKYAKGLCPFHNDHKIGSFVATESMGIWKCFSCGEGGDSIKFISLIEGTDYLETAFNLALRYGIISDDEYAEYYQRRRYTKKQRKNIEQKFEKINKEKIKKKIKDIADEDTLHSVFSLFIKTVGEHYEVNNKENYDGLLSKEHKKHLVEDRGLSEEEIINGHFFTFPTRQIRQRFLKAVREKFGDEEVLAKVPGFFKERGKESYTFVSHKGIGIGIKNAEGKLVGIQVRHDAKNENKSRYVWFSSSFALFDDKYECGTSSGSPVDVVYPSKLRTFTIFITEGRFKAMKIAKEKGAIALSVQGVSTWKGIMKELEKLQKSPIIKRICPQNRKFSINCILIAFDADMNYNYAVFSQARKMADYLQEKGYVVYYLNWNERLGKGIDDIMLNGHCNKIKRYDKLQWDKQYDKMVKTILDDIKNKTYDEKVKTMLEEDIENSKDKPKAYTDMKDIPAKIVRYYFYKIMVDKLIPYNKNEKSNLHLKLSNGGR